MAIVSSFAGNRNKASRVAVQKSASLLPRFRHADF
jgi:hypothetical protein